MLILLIEVPLLLRICLAPENFDTFVRRISTNWLRAVIYSVLAVIQYLSILGGLSALIVAAVLLSLTAICYTLAALKGQDFIGSKALGGPTVT